MAFLFGRNLALVIALIAGAQGSSLSPALADQSADRLAALEMRIAALEERLAASEARARGAESALAARGAKPKLAAAKAPEPTAAETPTAPTGQAAAAEKAATPAYGIVRENVATLSAKAFELSAGVGYVHNASLFQSDRAVSANLGARVGLLDGVEFGVNVPYYHSHRVTQVGPGVFSTGVVSSFGDATAQITALALRETATLPAVNVTVGAILPTGSSPYVFGSRYISGQNPIDPFIGRQSRGEWGTFGGVQFSKIVDPLILFAGFGYEYSFAHSVQSHRLAWPINWTYNFGLAFALTDNSTLGFAINGSYQRNLLVDGAAIANTGTEPVVARLSLSEKIAQGAYLEPSVGFGITKDAPNVTFGVALRKQY